MSVCFKRLGERFENRNRYANEASCVQHMFSLRAFVALRAEINVAPPQTPCKRRLPREKRKREALYNVSLQRLMTPALAIFLLPFIESDIQIFLQRFAHRGISRYPVSPQVDLIGGTKRGIGGYSAALEALSIRVQRRSNWLDFENIQKKGRIKFV